MGLDVVAYKNISKVEDPKVSETEDLIQIYHGHFSYQAGELGDGDYYDAEDCQHFVGIGYGGYSRFREELARIAGYDPKPIDKPDYGDPEYDSKSYFHRCPHIHRAYEGEYGDGSPFIELIAFSDCEGYICAEVSKKLHGDFKAHLDNAEKGLDEHFFGVYKKFMSAFEYVSGNGFVRYG